MDQLKTVLVVDDEIHIVHVVAIKLRNNGYNVITAENGKEALDLAMTEKPDIIVTDYQMPVMTGAEMVKKLRSCHEIAQTPVIMLTARSFALDGDIDELQIARFINKPFSPKELLSNIEDIINQEVTI
jgi:two-component system alkaline phosphatase synthesis response regulator PhoP